MIYQHLKTHIAERLKMHRDNLRLWQDGTLNPTEPDEEERNAVMRGLMGAINELEKLEETLLEWSFICPECKDRFLEKYKNCPTCGGTELIHFLPET